MDKFFLTSKTVWGAFLAVAPTILPMFGMSFGADDVTFINSQIDAIMTGVGGLLALYGRVKAVTGLKMLP